MNNQKEIKMEKNMTSSPHEKRFTVRLIARQILGKSRLDFELFLPDLSEKEIIQIAENYGFTSNHPRFKDLTNQIKASFTLSEIALFLNALPSLGINVVDMKINEAVYRSDPPTAIEGSGDIVIHHKYETFDFSTLDAYDLPFRVLGHHSPTQIVTMA